jgi:predicted glycoside hydrolase/deacetylase ChbG (UPF0249 family)
VPILVFNADDFGLSPGVTRGILESGSGVVRSTTVMANYVSEEEVKALRHSDMACGAHLNVSSGKPLTDYPQNLLKADGSFDKQRALDPATWDDEEVRRAAAREWTAQLVRLRDFGLNIDHLDSHHHSHMVGHLFAEAAQFAKEHDLPLRCRHLMRDALRRMGVKAPDDLIETYFGAGNISRGRLVSLLEHAQGEVVEVMCHPGYFDDLLRQRSGYLAEREQELAVLSNPSLVDELRGLGWEVGDYGVLL